METINKKLVKNVKKLLKEQRRDFRTNLDGIATKDANILFKLIGPFYYNSLIEISEQDVVDKFLESLSRENIETFLKYLSNYNLAKILNEKPEYMDFCSDERLVKVLQSQYNYNILVLFKNAVNYDIVFGCRVLKLLKNVQDGEVLNSSEIIEAVYRNCIKIKLNSANKDVEKNKKVLYQCITELPDKFISSFIKVDDDELLLEFIKMLDRQRILNILRNIESKKLKDILTRYDYVIITELISKELIDYVSENIEGLDLLKLFDVIKKQQLAIEEYFDIEVIFKIFKFADDDSKAEILIEIFPKYGNNYEALYDYLPDKEKMQMLQLMASNESLQDIIREILVNVSLKRELDLTEEIFLDYLKIFKDNKECSSSQ